MSHRYDLNQKALTIGAAKISPLRDPNPFIPFSPFRTNMTGPHDNFGERHVRRTLRTFRTLRTPSLKGIIAYYT